MPHIRKRIVEPNTYPPGGRDLYRFDLLVNSSADGRTGPPVWAPLCATEDDVAWYRNQTRERNDTVANIACKMVRAQRGTQPPGCWVGSRCFRFSC